MTSSDPTVSSFAALVKEIRKREGYPSQEALADALLVSRSLIAKVEAGGKPSFDFVNELTRLFPKYKQNLSSAAAIARTSGSERQPVGDPHPAVREIDALTRHGEYQRAYDSLRFAMSREFPPFNQRHLFELTRRMGHVAGPAGEVEESLHNLDLALFIGHQLRLSENVLLPIWVELIATQQRVGPRKAHERIIDSLSFYPTAVPLWERWGELYLFEDMLAPAYACFTTALQHSRQNRALHLCRGRVFAEWANFTDAVQEFAPILAAESPKDLNPSLVARAHAAFGLVLSHADETDGAIRQFELAEAISIENAELAYYRAIHYLRHGDQQAAEEDLSLALSIDEANPFDPASIRTLSPGKKQRIAAIREQATDAGLPVVDFDALRFGAAFGRSWNSRYKIFLAEQFEAMDK